jgi:hypothetical protein
MADSGPTVLMFTFCALVKDIAILGRVGMEGQRMYDIRWRHGHLEGAPCLPTVLCPVMCGSVSKDEGLGERSQYGSSGDKR